MFPTHRTTMTWPLTPEGRQMPPGELMDELIAAICEINSRTDYPRAIIPPEKFADITIDREHGRITAVCTWAWKHDLRHPKEEP